MIPVLNRDVFQNGMLVLTRLKNKPAMPIRIGSFAINDAGLRSVLRFHSDCFPLETNIPVAVSGVRPIRHHDNVAIRGGIDTGLDGRLIRRNPDRCCQAGNARKTRYCQAQG